MVPAVKREEVKRLRAKARSIRPGAHRAELLRKAAQIEAGLHMAKTLSPRPSKSHGEDAEVTLRRIELDKCSDESEAREEAKQLVDGHDVELWERTRLIERYRHQE